MAMSIKASLAMLVLIFCVSARASSDRAPVARWNFDEGGGSVARDSCGGQHGQIHGAQYVKTRSGCALRFDGDQSYVDCGDSEALSPTGKISLEAWVQPEKAVNSESAVIGKSTSSYLLTYFTTGDCYWYISGGGNLCHAPLAVGTWHHVVGTFDGTSLKLYIDGRLMQTTPSKFGEIRASGRLYIGRIIENPGDASQPGMAGFPGLIDDVRIYSDALTLEDVQAHFNAELGGYLGREFRPVQAAQSLSISRAVVKMGRRGEIQIDAGGESYNISSSFSFPGDRIGWNHLSESEPDSERGWKPEVTSVSRDSIRIRIQGAFYRLLRKVRVRDGKIEFEDRFTNLSSSSIGIIAQNHVTGSAAFRESLSTGSPDNPTLFLSGDSAGLGVAMEDNLSALKFEPFALVANQANFRIARFGLDSRKSHTFRWTIYLLDKGSDYFDFINLVRRDRKAAFTVQGPLEGLDVGSALFKDPEKLRAYLSRNKLQLVRFLPWLDYDAGSFDTVWSREEYRQRMREAIKVVKAVDPNIKCLGCIETDWATIYPEKIKGGETLLQATQQLARSPYLTLEQTKVVDDAQLPWRDSYKRTADGRLAIEYYTRLGKPQFAVSVYPAVGNYQYKFLMGQIQFLLDEVGMDGFYIDEFSQAWTPTIRNYDGWDGCSVEIDPLTGRIARKYIDCSLTGISARVNIAKYALSRGKTVVANTYATAREEWSLPVSRFQETQSLVGDPTLIPDGQEPPLNVEFLRGNLASPIALGVYPVPGKVDYARRIVKAMIVYLRHGLLYYNYVMPPIPESGEGSGEYSPLNHTYPITPLELHKGWILGKERVITAVSIDTTWKKPTKPEVHFFGLDGSEIDARSRCLVEKQKGKWHIRLLLKDWAEIAVVQ